MRNYSQRAILASIDLVKQAKNYINIIGFALIILKQVRKLQKIQINRREN